MECAMTENQFIFAIAAMLCGALLAAVLVFAFARWLHHRTDDSPWMWAILTFFPSLPIIFLTVFFALCPDPPIMAGLRADPDFGTISLGWIGTQ